MDETVYKIALAGYFHDIGKFAERAHLGSEGREDFAAGFYPDEKFLVDNMDLYQPHYDGKYTHRHAVYTAAFIDHIEKFLPRQFNKGEWGLGDSFINLAAGHHKPQTPLQWIVAVADRVSSGFERAEFEDYNKEVGVRDYRTTRLCTLFEEISFDDVPREGQPETYRFRYPLGELSPENIFPRDAAMLQSKGSKELSEEYSQLFFGFVDALEKLAHKDNIPLWLEHYDSLFMIFASHIPAATVGRVIPDVSLYDHSRVTAALASALYLYHTSTQTLEVDKIRDYDENKFLFVTGDFYGIQRFIFSEGGATNRAAAKILRGRSFAISLMSELAAYMLCQELGLPFSSTILNAAGKFTVLAPNTAETIQRIKEVEDKINKWLVRMFLGEAAFGMSLEEASCGDLTAGEFSRLWDGLHKSSENRKYRKVDLEKYGGSVESYLREFNNSLERPLCPFCGKRPSSLSVENDPLLSGEGSACTVCRDHVYLGTNLVKAKRVAVTTVEAAIHGDKLTEPIFGAYQVSLDVAGKLSELSARGQLLKYWDISGSCEGQVAKDITAKFIGGYVPKYTEEDNNDLRLLSGSKRDQTKMELIEALRPGSDVPKTFLHIAKKALNKTDKSGVFNGVEALGILKADVDNLGLMFAYGLRRYNLSRLATLSRQVHNFFSVYLPQALSSNQEFRDIYTVFAGGDDLFLIGPWNRVIDFSLFLRKSFTDYVCNNSQITISVGITVDKPGEPVFAISDRSEHALRKSKDNGRDSVTVFEETVKWPDFNELDDIRRTVEAWLKKGFVNKAFLFRITALAQMAKQEQEVRKGSPCCTLDDLECLRWRSIFKYNLVRNIGKGLKGKDREEAIKEVETVAEWLARYAGSLKIAIWQIIYNNR